MTPIPDWVPDSSSSTYPGATSIPVYIRGLRTAATRIACSRSMPQKLLPASRSKTHIFASGLLDRLPRANMPSICQGCVTVWNFKTGTPLDAHRRGPSRPTSAPR